MPCMYVPLVTKTLFRLQVVYVLPQTLLCCVRSIYCILRVLWLLGNSTECVWTRIINHKAKITQLGAGALQEKLSLNSSTVEYSKKPMFGQHHMEIEHCSKGWSTQLNHVCLVTHLRRNDATLPMGKERSCTVPADELQTTLNLYNRVNTSPCFAAILRTRLLRRELDRAALDPMHAEVAPNIAPIFHVRVS